VEFDFRYVLVMGLSILYGLFEIGARSWWCAFE